MEDENVIIVISETEKKILFRIKNKFMVTPEMVTGICFGLYSQLVDQIPEEDQVEFEDKFLDSFLGYFDNRYDYIDVIKENGEDYEA